MKLRSAVGLMAATTSVVAACSSQPQDSSSIATSSPSRQAPDDAELARAKAFVAARYLPTDVKSSFKTTPGDTIDCIDFFAQPGAKALAARGTPITELPPAARRPALSASKAFDSVAFDGSRDEDGNARACSDTTVPVVRITVDTILRAGGLDAYLKHLRTKTPPSAPPDSAGPAYAHAQSSYAGAAATFTKDGATLSVWTPTMPSNDTGDHSLMQTWTVSGGNPYSAGAPCAPNCLQTVEAGWTVDRGLNGDGNPHLFIFSTADGYQPGGVGSYNGQAGGPAWIGAPNAAFAPGMTLTSSTATPGSELTVEVDQCSVNGHCPGGWEVLVRTAGMVALSEVGYYAGADYVGAFAAGATGFTAGAEVYDGRDLNAATGTDTFALPMGNGTPASSGYGKAAYVRDPYVFQAGQLYPDLTFGVPASTVPQYGVFPSGEMGIAVPGGPEFDAGWANYFYVGSPPAPCSPATCASAGFNCGIASDGCGGRLSCGTCGTGSSCASNTCTVCVPSTCADIGKDCGSYTDGCGATLSCGSCPSNMVCQSGLCVGSGGGGGAFCRNCVATGGICTTVGGRSTCIHE